MAGPLDPEQLLLIGFVGVLAVIAAWQHNWNITGMAITGAFALLKQTPASAPPPPPN